MISNQNESQLAAAYDEPSATVRQNGRGQNRSKPSILWRQRSKSTTWAQHGYHITSTCRTGINVTRSGINVRLEKSTADKFTKVLAHITKPEGPTKHPWAGEKLDSQATILNQCQASEGRHKMVQEAPGTYLCERLNGT